METRQIARIHKARLHFQRSLLKREEQVIQEISVKMRRVRLVLSNMATSQLTIAIYQESIKAVSESCLRSCSTGFEVIQYASEQKQTAGFKLGVGSS